MSWSRSTRLCVLAAAAVFLNCGLVLAQEGPAAPGRMGSGCEAFKWPLERERAAFASKGIEKVEAGAERSAFADQAFTLQLGENDQVAFPVAPERGPKGEGPHYGGVLTFGNPSAAGEYTVTLSGEGWIDLVQDGKALDALDHTGARDCPGARKSVRFAVADAPVVLQISGSPSATINVAINAAE